MNLVSQITFLAGIVYVYLGYFGLKFDFRARLNQIFFLLCLACAWWAFCIAFMFSAANYSTAWLLLGLSSLGWSIGPPLILHFTIYLTTKKHTLHNSLLTSLIYIPGLAFTVLGMTVGVTSKMLVHKNFGWDNVAATDSPIYWVYVIYYLLCIGISIALVIYWGYHSNSKREKGQAKILSVFSFLGLLFACGSETLLPIIGITSFPKIPVIMWLFWAYGMWYAISKYRFLILTPEIATTAIVSSITDMLVMLDSKGQITIVNQPIQDMLGYASKELMHRPASTIFANKLFIPDLLRNIQSGTALTAKAELDYQSKNGVNIPVILSCSAIKDSFDELAGIVLVAQDLRPTRQLEQQNAELEAISNDLLGTNLALENRSTQIKDIFDNVGQGFLSFGPDLLIHNEYSNECSKIFGFSPKNQSLAQLIYPDYEQSEFLETLFIKILALEDKGKIDLYLSLLPSEAEINNRCISLEYRVVNGYFITILTDITERRLLEAEMEEEKTTLRMLVKAIVYYDTFIECIEDFKDFADYKLYEILDAAYSVDKKVNEVYRNIHTFKGNFSQFDTLNIVKKLHNMETVIGQVRDNNSLTDEKSLRETMQQFDMKKWLEADMKIITNFLGEEFWKNKDTFKVDKQRLDEIEEKMLEFLPRKEYASLLPYIRKLRYKSFKEMLKCYPEYVLQLAERLGKSIHPFIIEGDDILVDNDYYHSFARSLIHVFRNMVDHGIEYMDERITLGKSEMGSIKCRVEPLNDHIRLIISDDGAGIDMDKIRETAIALGKYSEAEIAAFDEERLNNLIYEDFISTSDSVTFISGRGVGLSAVKEETEKINGIIKVETKIGIGTEYIFDLPVYKTYDMPELSIPLILSSIVKTIQDLAYRYRGISLSDDYSITTTDSIVLNRYTAMINVRGLLDGIILMTYNENLVKNLAPLIMNVDINPEEETEVLEEIAAESTNIIIGNSLKLLGDIADFITISIPIVTSNWETSIRQSNDQIFTCTVAKDDFAVTSIFIPI
ncbi:MAG: ATP-binding protein [Syntrophomonas sp.]